uniref:Pip1e n=1 Tax=Arundo donax TaxID=35708 RepID=A0A0A9FJJ6_ARUDO
MLNCFTKLEGRKELKFTTGKCKLILAEGAIKKLWPPHHTTHTI